MHTFRSVFVFVSIASFLFPSCSFNYGRDVLAVNAIPDMVLNDVNIDRYENARISIGLQARTLEIYDTDRVWVAEGISFVQYAPDGTGEIESEGFAGIMLVDDKEEVYSLGEDTEVHLISDNLFLKASDLRWSKKTNQLSGSRSAEVEIAKDDGSVIRGTGFYADTLNRSYELLQNVSGKFVTGEPLDESSSEELANQDELLDGETAPGEGDENAEM